MKYLQSLAIMLTLLLAGTVGAEGLPDYYPANGFQRVGTLDSVQAGAQRLVIDDLAYSLASNVVIHSQQSYSVPMSRLRVGSTIGFKAPRGRMITEIWLLPSDYKDGAHRRR